MSRPWTETVSDWLKIVEEHLYLMLVVSVEKAKKPPALKITLEHLDREQLGRRHSLVLNMPCLPDGPTAAWFRACGQKVEPGALLHPRQCAGKTILVRFRRTPQGELKPSDFQPIPEETTNGR